MSHWEILGAVVQVFDISRYVLWSLFPQTTLADGNIFDAVPPGGSTKSIKDPVVSNVHAEKVMTHRIYKK